jgi:dihydroorotate dehydrogenase electron transfer subunit
MMALTQQTQSSKGVFVGRVTTNQPICRDHWRFVVELSEFPAVVPGQFVQILCADPSGEAGAGGAFLRRPFSIGGIRRASGRVEIEILHRVIGVGTRWLSQLAAGDALSLLGPLGRPFRIFEDRPIALLVGGGIGLPPLIWLAESLRQAGKQITAFAGARTADLLPLTRQPGAAIDGGEPTLAFREFAGLKVPLVVATDDGSLGASGVITEHFDRYLDSRGIEPRSAVVYTCGPDAMMHAVTRICERWSIACQVCLERMMGCGMGTCQSCVVRIRDTSESEGWQYRLCCTDGPVFDSQSVVWDHLAATRPVGAG